MKTLMSMIVAVAASVASAAVTTNYVNCAYKGGDSDGSKDKPWVTMEDGIDHLTTSQVLLVSPGYYRPTKKLSNSKQYCKIYATSANPRDTVIDGGAVAERLVTVHAHQVELGGFTITNAYGGVKQGSGIITNCVITGCVISNLTASGKCDAGAGIYSTGGSVYDTMIENCRVELWGTGTSDVRGGGVFMSLENAGTRVYSGVTISNCALVARSSAGAGGKYANGAAMTTDVNKNPLVMKKCRFINNYYQSSMTGWGNSRGAGGLCLGSGSMTDCEVIGNGGGSVLYAGAMAVTNCQFVGNRSSVQFDGAADVYGTLFESNTNTAGAVLNLSGTAKLRRSVMRLSSLGGSKASLDLSGKDNLISECIFEGSSNTWNGASLGASDVVTGRVENCVFKFNSASGQEGGAVFTGSAYSKGTAGTALTVRNCLFEGAASGRYAMYVTGAWPTSQILFESCTFLTNSCSRTFVGYPSNKDYSDYIHFTNCLFVANTAGESGTPTLTADNYWTDSLVAAKFADIANGDLHPKASSPAAKRGILRDWMAEATDIGSLTWSRTSTGVTVTRANTLPRIGREDKVSCGCYSPLNPSGLVLIFR